MSSWSRYSWCFRIICNWVRHLGVGIRLAGTGMYDLELGTALELSTIIVSSVSGDAEESVGVLSWISWLSSWNWNLKGSNAGTSLKTGVVGLPGSWKDIFLLIWRGHHAQSLKQILFTSPLLLSPSSFSFGKWVGLNWVDLTMG